MYVIIIFPEAFQNTAAITKIIYFEGEKRFVCTIFLQTH